MEWRRRNGEHDRYLGETKGEERMKRFGVHSEGCLAFGLRYENLRGAEDQLQPQAESIGNRPHRHTLEYVLVGS